MNGLGRGFSRFATRCLRRHLVGPEQRWRLEPPAPGWSPPPVERTSLYLHVPFCRNSCPYCPYTKVPYDAALIEPYTRAALVEVDRWADAIGLAEITSVYVGGGTPTHALASVTRVLERVRGRFRLTGDICIETSPPDIGVETVQRLHDLGARLVSLGVQSFRAEHLATLGRSYQPAVAERALALLASSGFDAVNADIMFALPGQTAEDVVFDLDRAAELAPLRSRSIPSSRFPTRRWASICD